MFNFKWLNLRSIITFPSTAIFLLSSFKANLILDFALAVSTKFNHSSFGFCFCEVNISTWSPLFNLWLRGTNLLFTLAPIQWSPILLCISYAKSNVVELLGKVFNSPCGVNTKISSENKFNLNSSIKSRALESEFSSNSLIFFYPFV